MAAVVLVVVSSQALLLDRFSHATVHGTIGEGLVTITVANGTPGIANDGDSVSRANEDT